MCVCVCVCVCVNYRLLIELCEVVMVHGTLSSFMSCFCAV